MPDTIHHGDYMTARANENHALGCDLVPTRRRRFELLVLDAILLEKVTAAQRLIWKILNRSEERRVVKECPV